MNSVNQLHETLARFKTQYGTSAPEPLLINDAFYEQLLRISRMALVKPERFAPEQLLGLRIVIDKSVPQRRVGYRDAKGEIHLI